MSARYRSERERIERRIRVTETGCWEWQGRVSAKGYGQLSFSIGGVRRDTTAHRFAYETFVGPIPDGLQIDHLCRNRACCNPQHLEPVTARINSHRSPFTLASVNKRKTHCPQRHAYDETNTYVGRDGGRQCRTCVRAAGAAHRARKALAAANVRQASAA